MNRFLSAALLCAGVVSSIATSSVEDYPEPVPTGDIAIGNFQSNLWVAPGTESSRTVEVAILMADLPAVSSSELRVSASAHTQAGWSDALVGVTGWSATGDIELFADVSNTYTDQIVLPNPLGGCQPVGQWCVAEWSLDFSHLDGNETIAIDYSVTATTIGPNTTVQITSQGF